MREKKCGLCAKKRFCFFFNEASRKAAQTLTRESHWVDEEGVEGAVPAEVAAVTVPGRARATADSGQAGTTAEGSEPEEAKPSQKSAIWQRSG